MVKTIEEAVALLKKDPSRAVRTTVEGLTIEVRTVPEPTGASAADLFARLGPWAGETTEEMLELLARARRQSGRRVVPEL